MSMVNLIGVLIGILIGGVCALIVRKKNAVFVDPLVDKLILFLENIKSKFSK